MRGPVEISVVLYRWLLPVFPSALRLEFREEMLATFEEHVRGVGLFSAWTDVGRDLVTVALPSFAAWIVVPVLTLLCSSVVFSLMLWIVSPNRHYLK
jgi:hypothetical protein